jgi:hypothetical protein
MAAPAAPRFDWRRGALYDYLLGVERSRLAWEWLRRTERYRRGWARSRALGAAERARLARRFQLVDLIHPELSAAVARPIWRAEHDPHVIEAAPSTAPLPPEDRFDIRQLARLAAVGIDDDDVEHWRIGTAAMSLRLDMTAGTLLGGPTGLSYQLSGVERLHWKLPPLQLLLRLGRSPDAPLGQANEVRAKRWIAELRTADALREGAHQQDIARVLFGPAVPAEWRSDSDSYRYRVQRLVRKVRERLANPLAAEWFR